MLDKPDKNLTERAAHLLRILVQRYIQEGQPVASKTLADEGALALSSASIRNIMADLEERGYLISPHTSAGRIPTPQAYRFFVDSVLTVRTIAEEEIAILKRQVETTANTQTNIYRSVTSLLSGITQLAGVVTLPKQDLFSLSHVEFLPLSGQRVLVVLVLNNREVQNRIIITDRAYSASELQEAANYINEMYSGHELYHVHEALLHAMHADRETMERLMQTVLDVTEKAFQNERDEELVVEGQDKLLDATTETEMRNLKNLFDAFAHKRDILHLLEQCLKAQEVQIFIGGESGFHVLDEYSLVTAPYTVEGKLAGVLGVIGPTRMSYERVIPIVDMTAKILSATLNKSE